MRILSDYERVVKVIAAQMGIDENEISEVHFLVDNLGMDTMDICEVVMALEEEFNIATGCLWIDKDISIDGLIRRVAVAVKHSSEESFEVNEQGGMKVDTGNLSVNFTFDSETFTKDFSSWLASNMYNLLRQFQEEVDLSSYIKMGRLK
jgi:acyl carrier protein